MKLRLDENTLNKYITEAFKQELKQNLFERKKIKTSNARYRVNFEEMSELVGPPKRLLKFSNMWGQTKRELYDAYKEITGNEVETVQKLADQLKTGKFGREEGFVDWRNMRFSHRNHEERMREKFIKTLSDIGYSNQQIHDALNKTYLTGNNGPFYLGYEDEEGRFQILPEDEAKEAVDALMHSVGDEIRFPDQYPDEEFGLDNIYEKGKEFIEKAGDVISDLFGGLFGGIMGYESSKPGDDVVTEPGKDGKSGNKRGLVYPWDAIDDDVVKEKIEAYRVARQKRIAARKRAEQERIRREEELRNSNAEGTKGTNLAPGTPQQTSSYDWVAQKTKAYADENPINLKPVVLNKPNRAVTATNTAIKNNNLTKTLQTNKSGDDRQNMNNQYYQDVVINAMTKNINTLPFDKALAGNEALEANAKNVIKRSVASGIIDKETGENEIKRISQARKNMEKRR